MDLSVLPLVNATLNGSCALLLLSGYLCIRSGRPLAHRRFMLSAAVVSIAFLSSYLYYHYHVGTTRFAGRGWSRPVYFTILLTHTILAVSIVPLAIITLTHGLRGRFPQHRRIARWTLPIWMYVSVTGVVVYLFLYQFFPSR